MQKKLHSAIFALVLAPVAMMAQVPITFTNQTSLLPSVNFSSGNAVGVCDMNNDGLDDIVRDSVNKKMFIDFQQPNGSFTEISYTTGSFGSPWGLCVGDYNNDGYNDVFQGSSSNGYLLTSNNAASFTLQNLTSNYGGGSVFTQGCNFFDIDNDGFLDVFICHDTGMPKIYKGDGTSSGWTFDQALVPMTQVPSSDNSGNYASIWTDINNDGLEDMMITHCRQGVTNASDARRIDQIFINNGNGTYTQDVTNWTNLRDGEQGWSTGWGDIDNDGDMDAFVLNQTVNGKLMVNDGSGVFNNMMSGSGILNPTSWFGENASFHDFDNDGWVDLLLTGDSSILYRNNGDYTFTRVPANVCAAGNGTGMRGQGVGDLNNDGFLDIYATYCSLYNSPSTSRRDRMWFNDSPNQGNTNHWIKFNLVGGATPGMSNRNAIGAIIKIYGSFGVQIRDVRSGEGYGLQNSFTVHFGLGSSASIDSLMIIWPSGIVDHMLGLNGDVTYTVNEGQSPLSTHTIPQNPMTVGIFPNPVSGDAFIYLNNFAQYGLNNLTVNVYDLNGKLVYTKASLQECIVMVPQGVLTSGMYLVEVRNQAQTLSSEKMMVK